jgi:hypothetical protein
MMSNAFGRDVTLTSHDIQSRHPLFNVLATKDSSNVDLLVCRRWGGSRAVYQKCWNTFKQSSTASCRSTMMSSRSCKTFSIYCQTST